MTDNRKFAKKSFQGKHSDLTEKIIGAFFDVYNELGYGFSEKVCENALAIKMRKIGLSVKQQVPITVYFEGQIVGEYVADLLIENIVMVELKAVRNLISDHEAQLLNYLKATEIEVGILLNFGPKAEFKRKVLDNKLKGSLSWTKPQ
ncbi:MAG: GxxExxY protein [Anaerolineales bacterium]|nr:GxxExxY protein [Anaerolineales bacterium]